MRKILAIVAALLLSQPASATKIYQARVPELYNKSDLVLFGTIQSGRVLPRDCGVEYVVRVDHPFKGNIHKGSLIRFRTSRVTQLGAEYFLFLSIAENEFSPVLSIRRPPTSSTCGTNMSNAAKQVGRPLLSMHLATAL